MSANKQTVKSNFSYLIIISNHFEWSLHFRITVLLICPFYKLVQWLVWLFYLAVCFDVTKHAESTVFRYHRHVWVSYYCCFVLNLQDHNMYLIESYHVHSRIYFLWVQYHWWDKIGGYCSGYLCGDIELVLNWGFTKVY